MAKGSRSTRFVFKVCLLIFFLILMWTARTYPEKSRLFPELLGGVTVIFIIASIIQDFIKPKIEKKGRGVRKPIPPPSDIREEKLRWVREVEEESEKDAGLEFLEVSERRKRLWQSVSIILISLGIGYLGGVLLTVPFTFIAFGVLHGAKRSILKYIVIASGVTLIAYLFFTTLMRVPLLRGALWDL